MSNGEPEPQGVDEWLRIYPCLRRCGQVAIGDRRAQDVDADLAALSIDSAFGVHRSGDPDVDKGRSLLKRVTEGVLQPCRDAIVPPVPAGHYGDQAILCWWCHVVKGLGTKSIYNTLRSGEAPLLTERWASPAKTTRERMWATDDPQRGRVTQGSLPGLLQIAGAWAEEFDLEPTTVHRTLTLDGARVPPPEHFDDAVLLGDVGAANGSRHAPSARFYKGWQFRNVGTETWTNRYLTRQGATAEPGLARSVRRRRIRQTDPGHVVEVGVHITAPSQPGTYVVYWEMTDAQGNLCFPNRRDLEVIFAFQVR